MATRRKKSDLPPTLADAMISAISPLLVIGMVGSLSFFLVAAFYQGEFNTRLMAILGLYTLATVGIARIAIESGRAHANLFSLPLAVVAYLAMLRYVTPTGALAPLAPVINAILLAVAWYVADRITFDCTELDDRDSGVRQGLLQSLGLLRRDKTVSNVDSPASSKNANETSDAKAGKGEKADDQNPKRKRRKRHNPGAWVLYFALLALPLFGLGQLVIPEGPGRNTAFLFLVSYLGCSLALLSTTAFLSTRRYLRHRGVNMPGEMSGKWLMYAGLGIAAILLISMILPLPGRSLGLVGLPLGFDAPEGLTTSRWGWGNESPDDAPRQANGNGQQEDGQQDHGQNQGGQQQNGQQQNGQQKNAPGEDAGGEKEKEGKGPTSQQEAAQQAAKDNEKQPGGERSQNDQRDRGREQGKNQQQQAQNNERDKKAEQGDNRLQPQDQQPNQQQPNQQQPNQQQPNQQQPNQQQPNQQQPNQQQPNQQQPNQQQPNEQQPQVDNQPPAQPAQPPAPPPSSSPSQWLSWLPTNLAELFKWLTIAVLVVIILIYLVTHPGEVAAMWRSLLDWLARLFGGSTRESTAAVAAVAAEQAAEARRRPFHSYVNPFAQGLNGWSPEQVVLHTFAALEAWSAERQSGRAAEETAAEFARRLDARQPRLNKQASLAANLLDRVMFAGWQPTARDIEPLTGLWRAMQSVEQLSPTARQV